MKNLRLLIGIPLGLLFLIAMILLGASQGIFKGIDLLPLAATVLFTLIAAGMLFVKRKQRILLRLVLTAAIMICGVSAHYANMGLKKMDASKAEENALSNLKKTLAPSLNFHEVMNAPELAVNNSYSFADHQFTLINFWATWCKPCLDEMPMLETFYQAYKDKGVQVIGFTYYKPRSSNSTDVELEKIEQWVDKLGINYPQLIEKSTETPKAYQISILPTSVLVDQQGNIVDYQIGEEGTAVLLDYITERVR